MAYHDQGFLTVLVVDDDAELRELLGSVIVAAGHQVVLAGSAEAGLEHLPYHTFDVAFVDHRLPGMEGLVLGEYLNRKNPHLEVVLMTGDPDPRLHRVAEAAGLVLLAKPFDITVLEELLERAIERDLARAEAQTPAVADPSAGGPVDLAPHFFALARAFAAPSVPARIGNLVSRRTREALEQIRYRDQFDERARAIAYSGIIAAEVLGIRLPKTKSGATMADWYDALMVESGRPRAFGDDGEDEEE